MKAMSGYRTFPDPFSSIKSKELYKNCLLCEFKIINFLQYTYKIFHDSVKCSNHFFYYSLCQYSM